MSSCQTIKEKTDNIVEKEISIHENMNDSFQSYIELNVEKLILKNNSDETESFNLRF